jgi:hypothetical protein
MGSANFPVFLDRDLQLFWNRQSQPGAEFPQSPHVCPQPAATFPATPFVASIGLATSSWTWETPQAYVQDLINNNN